MPQARVRTGSTPDLVGERIYLVRDNGVRCITTPCYSWDVREGTSTRTLRVSGFDVTRLRPAEQVTLTELLATSAGARVRGWTVVDSHAGPAGVGKTLVVTALVVGSSTEPSATPHDE
jgi:hypothetical protein